MLLRFFRSTGAQMLVIIPLMGVLLWLHSFIKTPDAAFLFDTVKMPSYKLISEIFPATSVFSSLLTFGLVIVQSILLVRLNTRFIFINNRTYLPALFFILLTSVIPDLQRMNPVIFSGFFLLVALEQIFESQRRDNKLAYEFFMASFLISIGSTFYPFLLFFIFIVWISLGILRPFIWREWMFTIMGFILPWVFVFSYYYLFHNEPNRVFDDFTRVFTAKYDFPEYSRLTYVFGGFLFILIAVSSQHIIRVFASKKILPRKAFSIFLWLFINTLAVYIIFNQASVELLFILAIPLSYLFAHYFTFVRSRFWGDFLMIVFLFLVVLIQMNSF